MIVVGFFSLSAVLIVIYFQKQHQTFPIGAVVSSLILTIANFYFASKTYIVEYFVLQLRRYQTRLRFDNALGRIQDNIRKKLPRSNQINDTRPPNLNDIGLVTLNWDKADIANWQKIRKTWNWFKKTSSRWPDTCL